MSLTNIFKKPLFLTGLLLARSTTTSALLATTTNYNDGLQGACGCGTQESTFPWSYGLPNNVYTAAANQALFDTQMEHWCGSGCGTCYRLTSTGVSSCETCGTGGEQGKSITVMVTNLCPYAGNEQWCANPRQLNAYGYPYHFDIMGGSGVFGDNVVVEFEQVECPNEARMSWAGCECHPDVRGKALGNANASAEEAAEAAGAGDAMGHGFNHTLVQMQAQNQTRTRTQARTQALTQALTRALNRTQTQNQTQSRSQIQMQTPVEAATTPIAETQTLTQTQNQSTMAVSSFSTMARPSPPW
ncbi:RlpA-like double-psi beta-barrel-protein domain-containing protein-containing protein [Aspergillus lucknowensis]|uniref:RlpA-like double-psi beta-barrel-protein domain-containing protein-containing protein n=1 Tax=Aspergillus lucknowensis TaxID=176173 RepID=A0ABR4L967_9EURO